MIFILFETGTPGGRNKKHKSIVDMATIKPEFQHFSMRPFGSVIKCVNRAIEAATVVPIDCGLSQRI